jgi:hypothetical protein
MPEKATRARAAAKKRRGNAPSTQAGEYVREEMHHKRSGKHPVKNRKQAIAIGLSKARRSGVDVPDKSKSKSKGKSRKRSSSTRRTTSSRSRSRSSRSQASR